jgi:hypothetical protein
MQKMLNLTYPVIVDKLAESTKNSTNEEIKSKVDALARFLEEYKDIYKTDLYHK